MASTPLRQLALPRTPNRPCHHRPELRSVRVQRSPTFFAARCPVPPPSPSCNSRTPGFFNPRILPPNQSHNNNYRNRPHSALPILPPAPHPTTAPLRIVPPHIARWMRIADEVVGRHPFAKPLFERVATPAEIALISSHVHIAWAHDARRLSQPAPVKVLSPARDTLRLFGHLELGATAEGLHLRAKSVDSASNDHSRELNQALSDLHP
jgi:hypothetical protein